MQETEDATSPPVAVAAMREYGVHADSGIWFMLHPVHLHIARDHLVLTDRRQLTLSDAESLQLFDAAKPLFAEAGMNLRYGDARTWFLRSNEWSELQTATPDAAAGHNIDIWMPKGPGERAWRKVQNEIQMHWHTHPVNAAREERGERPVNSLWMWGGGPASATLPAAPYGHAFNLPGWMSALGSLCRQHTNARTVGDVLAATSERSLIVFDTLIEPAFTENWHEWLARMNALDAAWLTPLHDALKAGKISRLTLILTHNTGLTEFSVSRLALRKFWIRPSLFRLAS